MRGFLERVAAIRESERLQALAEVTLVDPPAPERVVTPCAVCGKPIVQKRNPPQKCCSIECRSVSNTFPPKPCQICGKPFRAKGHPGRRKFCSVPCANLALRKVSQ